MIRVGVLGGTGYVGQELIRILLMHPEVEIKKIISESNKEIPFSKVYRNYSGLTEVTCEAMDFNTIADGIDVLFTALPYGMLMNYLTKEILNREIGRAHV